MTQMGHSTFRQRGFTAPNGGVFPRCWRIIGTLLLLTALGGASAFAAVPTGSTISNIAAATFNTGDQAPQTSQSNPVVLTVVPIRTGSTVEFMRYRPGVRAAIAIPVAGTEYSASGESAGPFHALPGPVPLAGTPINLTEPVPLESAALFAQGDPLFLRLVDPDQNRDAQARDTILLEISNDHEQDRELLRLHETGANTGQFLGFIQTTGAAGQAKDGTLSVGQDQNIQLRYRDVKDPTDTASASAEFDPIGRVFDSRTGQPLDRVTVRVVDNLTGRPATVSGNDGTSIFPAEIITGTPVNDGSGNSYDFGPGGFRFPHLADGQYRLEFDVPPGYRAPSRVSDSDLAALPGGPFRLLTPGSRGEPFFRPEQPLVLDIPIDPVDTDLFVTKTASKSSVAIGDFLAYEIRVANATTDEASQLVIDDQLPLGFRYQPGSTLFDGQPATDPAIGPTGRTLEFTHAALPAATTLTIRYVATVVPGAPTGDAINRATARWAQVTSNEATALVHVRRDLFGETTTILGRVVGSDCDADSTAPARGISGVRVYLESGAFAVTDEQGRYHLAGVAPGAHVVQLDRASLPPDYVPGDCSDDSLYVAHPWSHLVDLQGGTTWRSDFHLRRVPPGNDVVALAVETSLRRREVRNAITIETGVVPVRNARLTVVLPDGVAYDPGTSRSEGQVLPDPDSSDGVLVYRLGDLGENSSRTLTFGAVVQPPLRRADLSLKTLLGCDTPTRRNARSAVVQTALNLVPEVLRQAQPELVLRPRFPSLSATLSATDLAQIDTLLAALDSLEITAVKVIGHTDSQRIRPGARFADNHALSLARAEAVGDYISRRLHLDESQLSVFGMGAREPIASNDSAEGRARNRRVTLQVWAEKIVPRLPSQTIHDRRRTELPVTGFRPGQTWPDAAQTPAPPAAMPAYDATWLAKAKPGEHILWPPQGFLPHLPSLKLAVQHAAGDSVLLQLNHLPAGRGNYTGLISAPGSDIAISTWTGLDLVRGDNSVAVDIINEQGRLVRHMERIVHYSGPPVFVEFLADRSQLVADGKTRPVIAVRLTDADGYPARREVVGKFSVAAPHEAWRAKGETQRETITELQEKLPSYTIGPDGIALLTLAPTTDSGEALLQLGLADHEEELRVWLPPAQRDWILAGVVAGTVGYNTVAGNLTQLAAAGQEDQFYQDGRLAFFAKGRLKGKWLLTMAYDSQDPDREPVSGLFGVVDPDAYYTVYGDAVVQKHDAPTSDHLYLKLERSQFYALYGDYHTGLTMTELSRYSRAMTGFKASGRGRQLGFDVFASENRQNFRRDEIRGDGTSGLYHLSAGHILLQSEKISLQVRDRYRNELILSERPLTRSVDYTLDELDGTLFFKEPIPSQDPDFNPIWIVASYETEAAGTSEVTAGGRGSWRPQDGALEVGLTAIRAGTQGGAGDVLAGLDTKWDLTRALRLKAEYAGSDTRDGGRSQAWRGELTQRTGTIQGRLYYRDRRAGFGLGQQNKAEAGTRKFGLDTKWQPHPNWRADGTVFSQQDLINGGERQFGELKMSHNSRRITASLGARAANDSQAGSGQTQSRQLTADVALRVLQGKGRVRLGREQGLAGQDDLADFPTRTTGGLEYEILRKQKIVLAQEIVDGKSPASHRTRLGIESEPWSGAKVVSSAERRSTESNRRVFANLGLKQSLRLNDNWFLDASLDHGQSTAAVTDSTTGSDNDFTAGSVGATWQDGPWLIDQRLEYRTSTASEKWGLAGGIHVQPGHALGLLASLRLLRTNYSQAGNHNLSDISLGSAWRPEASPWTVLQRLSWRSETKSGDLTALANWRVVNNLNIVRRIGNRDQLSTLLGVRYNRDTIAGRRYQSTTDQLGLEWRHFIGSRWDLGVRGASRHAWQSGILDYSCGLSGGYKLLEDIWLSLGYNLTGYRDRDFSATDFTAQGAYLRFRVRLNQEVTRAMLR